jgi:uncharacterized protein DUF6714
MGAVTVICALVPDEQAILRQTLAQIEAAFTDAPRPSNDDLLHAQCRDDNDIAQLYSVRHWRELTDELVESEYAALSFLSPDGFRHFIAAYMGFALRNLASGAAAVDSTIWSLSPVVYTDRAIREFVLSKLAGLTAAQREAVLEFLEAVREHADEYDADQAAQALAYWRDEM